MVIMDKKTDAVGQKLCSFLTQVLGQSFGGLNSKAELRFSLHPLDEESEVKGGWISRKRQGTIADSRLGHNGKVSVCWKFLYQSLTGEVEGKTVTQKNGAWGFLGDLLVDILHKNFSDVLYLEEVEKKLQVPECNEFRYRDAVEKALSDPLLKYFLEEILDDKKLRERYSAGVMEKCSFPECKLLIHISAQLYEKRAVRTRIYFAEKDTEKCRTAGIKLEFGEDFGKTRACITMDNLRTIRKLMEMSGEEQGLLAGKEGMTYAIEGVISNGMEDWDCYIRFNGFLNWTAVFRGIPILEYENGSFRIPMADCDENKDGWLMELDHLPSSVNKDIIRETVQSLIENQTHGTAVLFMDNELLKTEVRRFQKYERAYRVDPFCIRKTGKALKGITSIDGALLADLNGYCHAAGAIVDGELKKQGDPSRGARYNSIENYIHWIMLRKEKTERAEEKICFAAILSEDGMVNLRMTDSGKTDQKL